MANEENGNEIKENNTPLEEHNEKQNTPANNNGTLDITSIVKFQFIIIIVLFILLLLFPILSWFKDRAEINEELKRINNQQERVAKPTHHITKAELKQLKKQRRATKKQLKKQRKLQKKQAREARRAAKKQAKLDKKGAEEKQKIAKIKSKAMKKMKKDKK